MKFSKLLFVSAGLFLVLASSIMSRSFKRRRDDKKCKKQYDVCTYKSFGSECCDGLTCDVYHFSIEKQGWIHYDAKDKTKGKCKLKQDQKCDTSDKELKKEAPCFHDLICNNYLLQSDLGTHCVPRSGDVKKLD